MRREKIQYKKLNEEQNRILKTYQIRERGNRSTEHCILLLNANVLSSFTAPHQHFSLFPLHYIWSLMHQHPSIPSVSLKASFSTRMSHTGSFIRADCLSLHLESQTPWGNSYRRHFLWEAKGFRNVYSTHIQTGKLPPTHTMTELVWYSHCSDELYCAI